MIPEKAIAVIKEFEGWRIEAYLCPAGVWTVGYGVTRINGRPVRQGDKLASEADGDRLLRLQLEADYLPKLRIIPGWEEMSDGQQSALISFAWNLGAHFYGSNGFATITNTLKARDWGAVPAALKLYNKGDGRTMAGLVRRRQAEADLWQRGLNLTTNEAEPMDLFYFLDFAMGLDNDGRLEEGRLVLRSVTKQGGRTHQVWVATSSLATRQKVEDFHQKGGPIPPEYRVPGLRAWEVETTPIAMPQVKGVEGNFYRILPYLVKTDKGGDRGDFGIHADKNTPGSLGCPVMSAERFKSFEAEMKRLRDLGFSKIPLFVTYPSN